MEDERAPKRRLSHEGLLGFMTPERPPHSPISAQQSPRPPPRSYPEPEPEPDTEEQGSQFSEVQPAYYQHDSLGPDTVDESRSPSVNGVATAKSQSPPRDRQLGYKPKLILRGHKKGVAQVRFSPDGKWIASCCKPCNQTRVRSDNPTDTAPQLPTAQSRYGTRLLVNSNRPLKATSPAYPASRGAPTPKPSPRAPTTNRSASGTLKPYLPPSFSNPLTPPTNTPHRAKPTAPPSSATTTTSTRSPSPRKATCS